MRRSFFLIALLLLSNYSHAWDVNSGNRILKFEAGYTTFRPYALNSFFSATQSSTPFSSFQTFGITSVETMLVDRGGAFDGAYSLHFFRPQENVIQPDTLKYRAGGWELMTSIYGFDLLKNVTLVDLIVAPGVFWGNIRLRKYNSTGNFKTNEIFKNPFVAPMIRADLRFMLGPVAIGGRFSYRYDITKTKWKKGSSEVLPGYRCEELQYMVYIGWRFGKGAVVVN